MEALHLVYQHWFITVILVAVFAAGLADICGAIAKGFAEGIRGRK